jgi:peptidylprolyl isomerase
VSNIRELARAHWYDGIAVVRVQDNYVAQWGDPGGEDPKLAKALPANLATMTEQQYEMGAENSEVATVVAFAEASAAAKVALDAAAQAAAEETGAGEGNASAVMPFRGDAYADYVLFHGGWPLGADLNAKKAWPIHCYGYVGVGRGMSPDAGSGAELYAVIGHAPRHLDRNIAVVGRVIEGIEHLSSLPRGTGQLGFYETAGERTPILSVRLASDLQAADRPRFQFLSTDSDAFANYAEARANRRDPFFIVPAGGADICNITVPIRRKP